MHAGDTLLHDALDLLEHVGVFLIDPVSQISTVIQDLTEEDEQSGGQMEKDDQEGRTGSRVSSLKHSNHKKSF